MAEDTRSMRDRMLAGDLYVADDSDLREDYQRAQALVEAFNRTPASMPAEQRRLISELLRGFSADAEIRPPFYCDYGYQISVGSRTFINYACTCLDVAAVQIGDDVQIGPQVQLLTATHPLAPGPRRDKWESAAPITIENNVWLAGGVIVCPGVTIGTDTVVGAGSVVTRDLPPGVLAVGSPARVVRRLPAA